MNLQTPTYPNSEPVRSPFLFNTLAQVEKAGEKNKFEKTNKTTLEPSKNLELTAKKLLEKKARCKYFTNYLAEKLSELKSPLKKSYLKSMECSNVLEQRGNAITARYCNARWCNTCNRIRTAKQMNKYLIPLSKIKNKYFVTLTIRNVESLFLKEEIENMHKTLKKIQKTFIKRKTAIIGVRKFEITYNAEKNNFHPHFHIILSGKKVGDDLIKAWLKHHWHSADIKGQDNRPADDHSTKELFKYFTKFISKYNTKKTPTIFLKALDVIFQVMHKKRVFQPMGIKGVKILKDDENINKITAQSYNIESRDCEWIWNEFKTDWCEYSYGVEIHLTNYKPSERMKEILKNIDTS